jgi:hypothetical protein
LGVDPPRRSCMWFAWSSGARGAFRRLPSPLAAFRIGCRSNEFAVPMLALTRRCMVRAMLPHSAGSACAGKIRSMLRLPGRSPLPSVTFEHVAVLWPSRTGPFGPSTGSRAKTFVLACVTLLTLAPTLTTPLGPCDPAAKLGFLSWGCPKIAPPSFKPRSRTPGLARSGVSA